MPAPSNDNFTNAQTISGASGSVGPVDVSEATTEVGEPVGSNAYACNHSIWYEWTCPADGEYEFDTVGSTADFGDTTLALWTGSSLGSLTELGSDDDSGGDGASSVVLSLTAGMIVKIQVGTYADTWDASQGADLVLSWGSAAPPANDNFENAELITTPSGAETIKTTFATSQTGETNMFAGETKTVWYKLTAPGAFLYKFYAHPHFAGGSNSIFIYQGSTISNLTEIGFGYELVPGTDDAIYYLDVIEDENYYIQVTTNGGLYDFSWEKVTDPPVTMELIESIDAPYKVYPGGVIAIRAADFMAPSRSGLSIVSDPTSNIGIAIRETQSTPWVQLNPNGFANVVPMFDAALTTIEIPWDSIPYVLNEEIVNQNYDVYIRYKLTGGRSGPHIFGSGLYTASETTVIACIASTDPLNSNNYPYDYLREVPFWQYMQCSRWSGNAGTGKSIIIKAFQEDGNDAVFLIDQIVLIPLGNSILGTDELSVWWGGDGNSVPSGFSDDPRAGDFDDWVGGKFSVIEGNYYDLTYHANGDIVSEFQKKADSASAEFTAGGIGKIQWDGAADFVLTGVGISAIPDYPYFFHDDFARTIAANGGWGTQDGWGWYGDNNTFGLSTDGTRGILTSTASSGVHTYRFASFGRTTVNTKTIDFNVAFGVRTEATIGWDTGVPDGSYVACVGEQRSTGVGGNDRNFFGLAILKSGGSWYAVIIQFNSWFGFTDSEKIREISSRVAISGSQPLDVTLTRKGQKLEAVVEGNTLTAYQSAILHGGGYPYPNRAWEDYPYPTDLTTSLTYGFYGIDPRDSGPVAFAHLIGSGGGTYNSYLYDIQLSLLQFGTQPTTAKLRIEKEITGTPFAEITLHSNAFQMISFPPGYYGSASRFNEDPPNSIADYFKLKAWLPVGSAELSRVEFYSTWFREHFEPIVVTEQPSVFWFYKDGEWHKSGDPSNTDDLYIYTDGEWRLSPQLSGKRLHGRLLGSWDT